jgi:hypothetical protein
MPLQRGEFRTPVDGWMGDAGKLANMSSLGLWRRYPPAGSINKAGCKGAAVGALSSQMSARTPGGEGAVVALKGPRPYEGVG